MKRLFRGLPCTALFLTCTFLFLWRVAFPQCAAAPVAAATCSGGNGAASNGQNVGSGQTYWISSASTFATINLNGGTLRVCGTLNLNHLNLNSGTLIVEAGGIVSITNISNNLNGNCVIINRGTINLASGFTMQNSGNAIYNDKSTSIFNISGVVKILNATVVNRGSMTITEVDEQGSAGSFCLQDQSLTTLSKLDNETADAFAYSGAGSPACLNIKTSAKLNSNLGNSPLIHVCLAAGITPNGGATGNPGGGWGSATLYTNCNSCATVLPLTIIGFTAEQADHAVNLQWGISDELQGDEVFYVEKSLDGLNFFTLTAVAIANGRDHYEISDPSLAGAEQYYRIKATRPSGASIYSPIVAVRTGVSGRFEVYPNPARANTPINLVIPGGMNERARLNMIDMAGEILFSKTCLLTGGSTPVAWNLPRLSAGTYVVQVMLPSNANLYARVTILD
ncbi:MAG: hypothetical protein Q8938_02905 [Bacteroidota bacterium]|nr:hypothetical protein [Bacteroidota bacterium]